MPDPFFLEVADRLGRRLCRDALWSDSQCNWLGWGLELVGNNWMPVFRSHGAAIYDGTAGIALFLTQLYRCTSDPMVRRTAIGALNRAVAAADTFEPGMRANFYCGWSGLAYACLVAGEEFSCRELMLYAGTLLDKLAALQPDERFLDICNGSAGTIPILMQLARTHGRSNLTDAAVRHGEALLRLANRRPSGWSWRTLDIAGQPDLLGYSHGSGGIASALAELAVETGRDDFRQAAIEGFRYEDAHFSESRGNWPDLRTNMPLASGTEPTYAMAWCHGAPGIGISRLRALELGFGANGMRKALEAAIASTASSLEQRVEPEGSFCLCHGGGGNAELLLESAAHLRRPELIGQAEAAGRTAAASYHAQDLPWPCGIVGGGESPSFMIGIAGIGYFFLRLYSQELIPSLLLIRGASTGGQALGVEV